MKRRYCPDRGDLIWLEFNPQAGHEQAGRRPAVVLSPRVYNEKAGLAVVAPVTNKKKGYPFEVDIPDGLPVSGVVLSDQIRSVDWQERNADYAGRVGEPCVRAICKRIAVLLCLNAK